MVSKSMTENHIQSMHSHPGNAPEYSFEKIEMEQHNPLRKRDICVLGSSVINGSASESNAVAEYLAARLGCEYTKSAVDGTTLVDEGDESYIKRLRRLNKTERYDVFICQLSTNDAWQEKPLGYISRPDYDLDDFDTHTVTGALEYIITYVDDNWGCPIVFLTSAHFENEHYETMIRRLKDLQGKYRLGIIDLWSDERFNDITDEERALYMIDEVHPTTAGYRDWWGPEIERQLLEFMRTRGRRA